MRCFDYIYFQNKLGDTPLHSAAWKGHADIVKILLERGILQFNALIKAFENIVILLLEEKKSIDNV